MSIIRCCLNDYSIIIFLSWFSTLSKYSWKYGKIYLLWINHTGLNEILHVILFWCTREMLTLALMKCMCNICYVQVKSSSMLLVFNLIPLCRNQTSRDTVWQVCNYLQMFPCSSLTETGHGFPKKKEFLFLLSKRDPFLPKEYYISMVFIKRSKCSFKRQETYSWPRSWNMFHNVERSKQEAMGPHTYSIPKPSESPQQWRKDSTNILFYVDVFVSKVKHFYLLSLTIGSEN